MNKNNKILLAFAAATLAGVVIYMARHRRKTCDELNQVANEGYETAHDVLFPGRPKKRRQRVHYGPVLPNRHR